MLTPTVKFRAASPAFSLVEVVLALGVIGFSLVAILGVFPTGMRANRLSITDTRAAQLVSAIVATIDSQAAQFSSVDCYGITLDLDAFGKDTTQKLYATYSSSPVQPTITREPEAETIYFVDLSFDNDPEVAPGTRLGPGKLNLIQIRIRGRSPTDGSAEFFHLVRKP